MGGGIAWLVPGGALTEPLQAAGGWPLTPGGRRPGTGWGLYVFTWRPPELRLA